MRHPVCGFLGIDFSLPRVRLGSVHGGRYPFRLSQSDYWRLSSRPQRLPRRRHVLSGQLHVSVLPRRARICQSRPYPLAADRQHLDARLATPAGRGDVVDGHLCPHHPLPRRHLLHGHDQRGPRRQLLRHGTGPARTVERTYLAEAGRHRPLVLLRGREVLLLQ